MEWMTKQERLRLTRLGQQGDVEARNAVIMSVTGMVNAQAMRYCRAFRFYGRLDEVFQVGMTSVAEDFDKIDTYKKHKGKIINPITYLVTNARWRMLHYCKFDGIIRVPDGGRSRDKRVAPINSTVNDYIVEELPGYSPKDIEERESEKVIAEAVARLPKNMQHVVKSVIMAEKTLSSTGQEIGLSKERIRQIKEAALKELRNDIKLIKHFVN